MNSLVKEHGDVITRVLGFENMSKEAIALYDDNALKLYWFLKANGLVNIELPSDTVISLKQSGFLKSHAMLHSLKHLQKSDVPVLRFDGMPADLALERICRLPECNTPARFISSISPMSDWFSIQCGAFAYNLPNYLWWFAADVIKAHVQGEFSLNVTFSESVPVILVAGASEMFGRPRDILEFRLSGGKDPVLDYVNSFLQVGLLHKEPDYMEKILTVFPAVQLYEFDANWRHAFVSPIADKLVAVYEPGDTFFDAAWKSLETEIKYMPVRTDHVRSNIVDIFGTRVDLIEYVLRPKLFLQKMKGE